ncbi:hypothetical protein [Streptomyces collinus]|uniref:hypothetical protein n=1 Tax=Streptomyces collinus TaxID=42684 RepID=UPI0033CE99B6
MSRWVINMWRRWRRYALPAPATPGCVQGAAAIPPGFGLWASVLLLGTVLTGTVAWLISLGKAHPVEVGVGILCAVALEAATGLLRAAHQMLTDRLAKRRNRHGLWQ